MVAVKGDRPTPTKKEKQKTERKKILNQKQPQGTLKS